MRWAHPRCCAPPRAASVLARRSGEPWRPRTVRFLPRVVGVAGVLTSPSPLGAAAYSDFPLGLFLVRGDSIVLLGEVSPEKEGAREYPTLVSAEEVRSRKRDPAVLFPAPSLCSPLRPLRSSSGSRGRPATTPAPCPGRWRTPSTDRSQRPRRAAASSYSGSLRRARASGWDAGHCARVPASSACAWSGRARVR